VVPSFVRYGAPIFFPSCDWGFELRGGRRADSEEDPTGSSFFRFLTRRVLPPGWLFFFGCRVDLPDTTNPSPPRIAASGGLSPSVYLQRDLNQPETHAHTERRDGRGR